MKEYINYKFEDSEEFVSTFDEVPLWSAAFGLLLLKHLELKSNITIVDLGSGTGFPLIELAGRLGNSCKLYGVEPWKNANTRARQKIKNYGYRNIELIECSAANIPLQNNSVDLIVSNLGINNFEHRHIVFKECYRILRPSGKLAITTNLNGHWKPLYDIFENTLKQFNKTGCIEKLIHEQEHRGGIESISKLFTDAGLNVRRHYEESLQMKFLDGPALLNHHFVKLGWISSWLEIVPKDEREEIFSALENNLNAYAARSNGLLLGVPMAFIEGEKP